MPSGTAPYWMTRWRKDQPLVVKWTFNTWYMQNILKHTRWAFIVRPINNPVQVPRLSLTSEIPTMLRQRRLNSVSCQLWRLSRTEREGGKKKPQTHQKVHRNVAYSPKASRLGSWRCFQLLSSTFCFSPSFVSPTIFFRTTLFSVTSSFSLSSSTIRSSVSPTFTCRWSQRLKKDHNIAVTVYLKDLLKKANRFVLIKGCTIYIAVSAIRMLNKTHELIPTLWANANNSSRYRVLLKCGRRGANTSYKTSTTC